MIAEGALGKVAGCVVAGGRSVRMGRDKGAIEVAGQTLLERAIETLSGVCAEVCVAGSDVTRATSSVPVVRDRLPGCGPLSGVVAGLGFGARVGAEAVLFLPVDMPLLPAGLLEALLHVWRGSLRAGARACCAEADGVAQPLITLLHVEMLEKLDEALERGEYRLRPALMEAARAFAETGFVQTSVPREPDVAGAFLGWVPSTGEMSRRSMWFSNCNTPEQMETAMAALRGEAPAAVRVGE